MENRIYIKQTSSNFEKIMEELKRRGAMIVGNEKPATFESVGGIPCWGINVFGTPCFASESLFIKHGYIEILV
jgi:hypothetical protein